MDRSEFINKMLGVRWVNRASSFDSCDCWGLVILYYKHVLNINLPEVEGYEDGVEISDCWNVEIETGRWKKVEIPEENGLVFTCYRDGDPSHVGIFLGAGKVLHTTGGFKSGGSVQVNTVRNIGKMCGKMTYHKFIG